MVGQFELGKGTTSRYFGLDTMTQLGSYDDFLVELYISFFALESSLTHTLANCKANR